MIDLPSYQYQLPATKYVQAVIPTRVLVFRRPRLAGAGRVIVGWPELERTLVLRSLLEGVEHLIALGHADATTKYTAFLRTYSRLANQVPLTHLALYLGITPPQSHSQHRCVIR